MHKKILMEKMKEAAASVLPVTVIVLAVCLLLVQTGMLTVLAAPVASVIRSDELRGVWISYLDWEKMPADR